MPKDQTAEKAKMLLKLEEYKGNVKDAGRAAWILTQTHYNWCKRDPEYKKAVDEILIKYRTQQNT